MYIPCLVYNTGGRFNNHGDDGDSLNTADREERTEEEDKAKDAFGIVAMITTVGGIKYGWEKQLLSMSYITVHQFGELLELLGLTYCEGEHQKTIKKLKKNDTERIYQSDFLSWYIDWLFSDDDDEERYSDEEDNNEEIFLKLKNIIGNVRYVLLE